MHIPGILDHCQASTDCQLQLEVAACRKTDARPVYKTSTQTTVYVANCCLAINTTYSYLLIIF